ncbi:MAG TPA: tRNA guanosine(34) transglycosylase Tgt [Planctomycetota bacterium]|nr:tRNA guanosine(34) transglycosylase Tgt [Planctomycetota bacterium]
MTEPRGPFTFSVDARDGRARAGRMLTPHGAVETPTFMAVGTAATVKALTPEQVRRAGVQVALCNTYHLALRPGVDVIRDLGGLHRFMRWDAPILTDSGGFQVFSLATLAETDADGVTFRNHLDGSKMRLTPERAMEIQEGLGSDVAMVFDECLPYPSDAERVTRSLYERTLPWELRSLAAAPRDGRACFAIGQGGFFPDLREACLRELTRHPFDGFALGGLSVGESFDEFRAMVDLSTALLPEDRPRYVMGVGTPREMLAGVALGIDLYDCVLPTRNGRNGQALTADGPLKLRNAAYARDPRPLEADCACEACGPGFSRAYLRHLFVAEEMLAATLVSSHNLAFLARLMAGARAAVVAGRFAAYAEAALARWPAAAGLPAAPPPAA